MRIALKATKGSTHKVHKMAAVVIKGGSVVSVAANTNLWGDHAELKALVGKKERDYRGGVIIVARKGGRCSKPCKKCHEIIKKAGIRKMIYVNRKGEIEESKV